MSQLQKITTPSGQRVLLSEQIGEGGEGKVFRIESSLKSEVAKIYHELPSKQLVEKLRILSKVPATSEVRKAAALPSDLLLDENGATIGYKMDHIRDHHPFHEISNPGSLRRRFPKWTFKHLWRIASNLSLSLAKIHQSKIIVGDINESNILISPQCTVVFIDSDSFQIRNAGKLFPCLTGVPDYTSPDLAGRDFSTTERTTSHDCFGLAVCIFQLLVAGRHPFSGTQDPDLLSAIASRNLPFTSTSSNSTDKYANPLWMALPHSTRELLVEGLVDQHPPDAETFFSILGGAENEIRQRCSQKLHFSSSAQCPWCAISAKYGLDFFSDLRVVGNTEGELLRYISNIEEKLGIAGKKTPLRTTLFAIPQIINPENLRGVPLLYRGPLTYFSSSELRSVCVFCGVFTTVLATLFVYFSGASNLSNAVTSLTDIPLIGFALIWCACLLLTKIFLKPHPLFVHENHLNDQATIALDRYRASLQSLDDYKDKLKKTIQALDQSSTQCLQELKNFSKDVQRQQGSDRQREIQRCLAAIEINHTTLPAAKKNALKLLKQEGYLNLGQLNRRSLLAIHGIGEITTNMILGNVEKHRRSIDRKISVPPELGEIKKLQERAQALATKANGVIESNKNDSLTLRELGTMRVKASNEQADAAQALADGIESLRSSDLPYNRVSETVQKLLQIRSN